MRKLYPLAMVACALAVTGCSTMKGKPAPNFELTALDGKRVELASFRGKPVLLAFFAAG